MSQAVALKTEKIIDEAMQNKNSDIIEKETLFILQNIVLNLPEAFSNFLKYVKPVKMTIKQEPEFLFNQEHVDILKSWLKKPNIVDLTLEKKVGNDSPESLLEFAESKFEFDNWFYEITNSGVLEYVYTPEHLISVKEAAEELKVSRQMVYKYIDRGLECVETDSGKRIPKSAIELWKDPEKAFEVQWVYQVRQNRIQTPQQKLQLVREQIEEFEEKYKGTFEGVFGDANKTTADSEKNSIDYLDWLELEIEKKELLKSIATKRLN